jgi:hypothetical protein
VTAQYAGRLRHHLLGANDACLLEAAMTPVATYATRSTAMATLSAARRMPASLSPASPYYHLWFILKDNASARSPEHLLDSPMLANPLSTAQEDVDRRNRVRQRWLTTTPRVRFAP